ncbi:ribonuclease H-like domain-containing protein [Tanacetum coccineum]
MLKSRLSQERILGTDSETGGLYVFDMIKDASVGKSNMVMCFHVSKLLWHNRLGHPSDQVLSVLHNDLDISKSSSIFVCEVCYRAKQTRDHKSKKLGKLVHLDLWGPYRVSSREGYKYFLTVVDDYSRAVCVYLAKTKDEVFEVFVSFINMLDNQFEVKVKTVRSDNGTEFVNHKMSNMFSDLGIIHQTSCAHTPRQNEIAKRLPSSVLKDVDIVSESKHLSLFDNQMSQSPYDEESATSVVDSSVSSSRIDTPDTTFTMYEEENTTTQIDDKSSYEGNISDNNYGPA